MLREILLTFIPIFFAVDAIGVLPLFVGFTRGINRRERYQIVIQSVITALCLAVSFIFFGKMVFKFLGITMGDFMVAGGSILFCIAIMDILYPGKKRRTPIKELGAVPLGTPLIVGPAVLTTSMIMIGEHGIVATLISVLLNVLLAGIIFLVSDALIKALGEAGTKALSKIMSLLIAAIAIMMVRKGIFLLVGKAAG